MAELFPFVSQNTANPQITNLYAHNGLSATSGLGTLIGSVQDLFIEEDGPLHNHGIATRSERSIPPSIKGSPISRTF
jgi:hypothetical protein